MSGSLRSAKGAATRRHTEEELREVLGGELDTATVLRCPFHIVPSQGMSARLNYKVSMRECGIATAFFFAFSTV
jgi:hypothetical protein